jgi:hypothetical protein
MKPDQAGKKDSVEYIEHTGIRHAGAQNADHETHKQRRSPTKPSPSRKDWQRP